MSLEASYGAPSNALAVFQEQKAEKAALREENSVAQVAFAYSNTAGNLLLALPNSKGTSNHSFARAVCGSGQAVDVKFEPSKKQAQALPDARGLTTLTRTRAFASPC